MRTLVCLSIAIVGWQGAATPTYDSRALAGRSAAPLELLDRSGRTVVLSPTVQDLLIYVVTPKAGFCRRNSPNILALYKERKSQYRFVAISLLSQGLESDLAIKALPFEVLIFKNHRDPRWSTYGFGAVPSLYLVSARTKTIERAWGGAFDGPSLKDAEQFFSVKLPGLAPDQPSPVHSVVLSSPKSP